MLLSDKYPLLTNYFTETLSSKKHPLPQSIIFYGNDLNSQYILAKEIARHLNCNDTKADDCECLNCRWIRENTHPAIMTVSRLDNKPENDDSKTVISIKQAQKIKEILVNSSEFHRVFIFCDRNDDGTIGGLNRINFQEETANSLLKIVEEPHSGVTFIFLTRYIDDLLSTIVSRSQCFFVPTKESIDYSYDKILGVFDEYWTFERKQVFDVSQKLQDLNKNIDTDTILTNIQNYILNILRANPKNTTFIKHIEIVEQCKLQAKLGMRPANIFDELCLNLIK